MERMEKHRPEWQRGDTLRSLRDLGSLALDTIANLIPIDFEIKVDEVPEEEA